MGNNVQYHVSLPETRYRLYRVFFVFRDAVPVPSPRAALIQNLTSQSAEFVMEEHVQLSTGLQTQERHLFLFSDTLIIAKSKLVLSI